MHFFDFFICLRPKQWVKNLMIFIPLFFGKKFFNLELSVRVLEIFLNYCLLMGALYCLNDIFDYEYDKKHPLKRLRPIAAGKNFKIFGGNSMRAGRHSFYLFLFSFGQSSGNPDNVCWDF